MGTPMCKPPQPQPRSHEAPEMREVQAARQAVAVEEQPRPRERAMSQSNRSSYVTSQRIDRIISQQKKEELSRMKILLLGGADAGKSTIVKQMRILHMSGFTEDEVMSFQKYLRYNLFQMFHEIANGILATMPQVSELEVGIIEQFAQGLAWIIDIDVEAELGYLRRFGQCECVRQFMITNANWPSLPDNTHYFLPELRRLLDISYKPNEADILHLRIPTSNISEINFNFSTCTIRLIDVGGQRTYRKKWIHCFEGVAAVLFVASIAAYDQTLEDIDPSTKPILYNQIFSPAPKQKATNRLRDSAHLFGEMLRNTFLKASAFILFLNKKDLLEKKLPERKLSDFIKGYDGNNEYEEACDYMKHYFLKRKSKKDRDRKIYSHFTCATDTQNVEFVFKATCDIVLQKNLNSSGIQ